MILTFSTIPTRDYLQSTLDSALSQSADKTKLDVHFLVDPKYANKLDPSLPGRVLPCHVFFDTWLYRITGSYLQGLKLVAQGDAPYGFLCEDDVQFAPQWDARALEIADSLDLPILSLGSSHKLDLFDPPEKGALGALRFKSVERFYGLQAILWSKAAAVECASQLEKKLQNSVGAENVPWLIDGVVRTFCKENDLPMWVTNPSLVRHIGLVSTQRVFKPIETLRFDEAQDWNVI